MRRIVIVTFVSLAACHGSDNSSGPDAGGDPNADTTGAIQLSAWTSCSLAPGANDGRAECATAEVPLNWDRPDGRRISLALKRLPASEPETGQYWMLQGGPGGSAVNAMAGMIGNLATDRPDLAYYAVDHRGVGGSTRLRCDVEDADGRITTEEWPGCIDRLKETWGDDLAYFATTPAARDIGELVKRLRPSGERLFVFGASYGTYHAQRYLQIYPDQPDGVIIEGIVPPDYGYTTYDTEQNEIGMQLIARCEHEASCSDHFAGRRPWDVAAGLDDLLADGHCPEVDTAIAGIHGGLRGLLGSMMYLDLFHNLVPAVVFRLDRCSPEDVAALGQFVGIVQSVFGTVDLTETLQVNIATNEMWFDGALTASQALAAWQATVMSIGFTKDLANLDVSWPDFPKDAYVGRYSDYSGPMLMLQGGFDPATVPSRATAVRDHYNAANQTWAFFPDGAHQVSGPEHPCGHDLVLRFLEKPTSPIDLTCIGGLASIDFAGDPNANMALLGTTDAWGD